VNDIKEGRGIFSFFDGSKFEGNWNEDKPNGSGMYSYANGSKLEGRWNLGTREGKFTLTSGDGKSFTGTFKDNSIIVSKECTVLLPSELPWSVDLQTPD